MNKKNWFIIMLIAILLSQPLFAFTLASVIEQQKTAPSYGLFNDSITLTLAPNAPLYREALADPQAMSSKLALITMQDFESIPRFIRVANDGGYADYEFRNDNPQDNSYIHMKTAVNLGFMRFSWLGSGVLPSVETEFSLQGGMTTVFNAFGGTRTPGFQGMYFIGVNTRIAGKIAVRFGLHHFSGHYGDEILGDFYGRNPDIAPGSANPGRLLEYTRDNSLLAGVSIEPNDNFRLYFEAELPQGSAWIRPAVHVPGYTLMPGSTTELQKDHIAEQEELDPVTLPASYRAWRLQAGTELRLGIPTLGNLYATADAQFHQDGQTMHMPGMYDEDNPWEMEITAGIGLELPQQFLGRIIRFEYLYHSGRFPLLNFFYQRSNYVSIGLGISG
jgi:hypothetical protein